jgi:hypothetical protein
MEKNREAGFLQQKYVDSHDYHDGCKGIIPILGLKKELRGSQKDKTRRLGLKLINYAFDKK